MNEEKETLENGSQEQLQTINITNENKPRSAWVVILAGFGIVAVLIALGIGIFQLAGKGTENLREVGSNLGNLFGREESITLSTSSMTIASNEENSLSIIHRNKKSGDDASYSILFECSTGINVTLAERNIPCNELVEIEDANNEVSFSINSTAGRYTDVPVVAYFESDEKELESNLLLTVVNRQVASDTLPTPKDKTEKEKESVSPTTKPSEPKKETVAGTTKTSATVNQGTPDIKVRVDGVGYIDPETRNFIHSKRVKTSDRAAVKFTILNIGTKETGNWYFYALLPVEGKRYHYSGKQISLRPGQEMEFTLAFDDIDYYGDGTLFFNADPANQVREISKLNNITSVKFDVRR